MNEIIAVGKENISEAARVHSISWIDSHKSFCEKNFVEKHTPEHQIEYISNKMKSGTEFYMLVDEETVGVVSVTGNLIEDLYVIPLKQRMGYGTKLLQFAVKKCSGTPSLWILENNKRAEQFYCSNGFKKSGRVHSVTNGIDEVEFTMMDVVVKPMETDDEKKGKAYVHWKAWHEAYEHIISKDYLDHLTLEQCEKWAFEWTDNTYVAMVDGKVAGFVCFSPNKEVEPVVGEIFAIYVLSEYYGTGVAQKLMDLALEGLKEYPGCELWVLKDNPRAIRFYEKYGFKSDGTFKELKSLNATEMRMVKYATEN